jgi:1A family penicillin-binding protein
LKKTRSYSSQRRQPAYRAKPVKPYQKPFVFARDKYRRFRSLSLKKQLGILAASGTAFLIVVSVGSYIYFARDINDKERLMNRNSTGMVIVDRNDEIIFSYGRASNDTFLTLDEISDITIEAVIASEDKGFYDHVGFSPRSIVAAAIGNLLSNDLRRYGGSTITQQLVKNNLLYDNKSFFRKFQELAISVAIERNYTKDEILEMYLNSVYFGEAAFGIDQAAEVYFGVEASELDLAQSALLIGLLPAPSTYSPISGDIELAKEQQDRVFTRMIDNEFITTEEAEAASNQRLVFVEGGGFVQENAHHFTEMVRKELNERYGEEQVARAGYKVTSTVDMLYQKAAEERVASQIASLTWQGATNGAMVAIDPKNGEVIALVGSADWENEQFGQVNMATSPRQPGSSFKPIYYAEAIEKKAITASTLIRDEAKTYGGTYTPRNFDNRFRGDVTARSALATSLNIPAIEVMSKVGLEETVETAQRMGLDTINDPSNYGLSLALGTAEASLLDMTNAYAAFANSGSHFEPTTVLEIEDKFGNEIYSNRPSPTRVQSPEASYIISSILSDNRARSPMFGNNLTIPNRTVAVKTGTTDDNKDAWTIGYTPSLALGVWVGDNENKPMQMGGSAVAAPIWRDSVQQILGSSRDESFLRPSQIETFFVCTVNGSYDEFYVSGTAPTTERCDRPPERDPEQERLDREEAERRKKEEEERIRLEKEEEERRRQEEEDAEEDDEEEDGEPDDPATPPPGTDPVQPPPGPTPI